MSATSSVSLGLRSLRWRLSAMVLLALLGSSLSWGVALAYLSHQEGLARDGASTAADHLLKATRWRALVQISADATVSSIMNTNPVAQAVLTERLNSAQTALQGAEQAMQHSATDPAQAAALAQVQQLSQTLAAAVEAAKAAKAAGELAKAILLVSRDVQPKVTAYLQAIDGHVAQLERRCQALDASHDAQRRNSLALALSAAAVVIALGLALVLLLAQRLAQRIARCSALAGVMAEGDLSQPVPAMGDDELGQMATALERMRSLLATTLGDVQHAVGSVSQAAGAISTGSHDLRQRSQDSAQRLSQTVHTVRQLRDEVGQAMQAAQQAQQMAGEASGSAQRGGEVVGQVLATIDGISGASQRIAEIVGVIDGIAFQTNILALNAAVEAARAGELGRGFAVVAGEVRALAQRCAHSAREIRSLVGNNVAQVEAGAERARGAGDAIQLLVSEVGAVSATISTVSQAAGRQSGGISQVTDAITLLDDLTAQNNALIDGSAAAADALSAEASRLAAVVGRFRLPAAA